MAKRLARGKTVLARWARGQNMTATELAVKVGKSHSTVLLYLKDPGDPAYSCPPFDVMETIYRLSEGAVTPSDFYPLGDWRAGFVDEWNEATDAQLAAEVPADAVA